MMDGSTRLTQYSWQKRESRTCPNGPNYPHYPCVEWLCIRRMKYACIVYLRKSISFPHLQINRYNGIADIDLLDLQHSLSLFKIVSLLLGICLFSHIYKIKMIK